jgi:hypothetical protein|uniref:Uncharacterized protein n=1 Tax=Picea sitchensis TaxID=3332 RepID=A0A6B9XX53_PICSI|nr:hypothetical protein Q903MT_gene4200 [Picea sitchensis]
MLVSKQHGSPSSGGNLAYWADLVEVYLHVDLAYWADFVYLVYVYSVGALRGLFGLGGRRLLSRLAYFCRVGWKLGGHP